MEFFDMCESSDARPAIFFEVDIAHGESEFVRRVPGELDGASYWQRVVVSKAGEPWPKSEGEPLSPIFQINLDGFPFKPKPLASVGFLVLFLHPERFRHGDENGSTWCFRSYRSARSLVEVDVPKKFSNRPSCAVLPELVLENSLERLSGFKLGGWPRLPETIDFSQERLEERQKDFVLQFELNLSGVRETFLITKEPPQGNKRPSWSLISSSPTRGGFGE